MWLRVGYGKYERPRAAAVTPPQPHARTYDRGAKGTCVGK